MDHPSSAELAETIRATQTALNLVWILVAAFLVMLMQAGFALVETGLTRAKNVAHTMGMNFLVYSIGIIGFWSVGFALLMGGVGPLTTLGAEATLTREFTVTLFGKDFGLFGLSGFFLSPASFTPAVAALFLFQMVFMDTAATIPTGTLAERWRFASFIAFSLVMSTVIYPVYANWVWGGGWLATLGKHFGLGHGHVDFAGSSVVHLTGGVCAFVGARLIGPRIGKFTANGKPRAIPGHNVAYTVLGTFILAFGWFGFNAGSTLAGMDARIAVVAVNTMLASAVGASTSCAVVWLLYGKPDVTMMCNGMLAGMVAITAPCAFVGAGSAVLIGSIAGLLVIVTASVVENRLRLDDPVGAIAVHGANGIWGVLALGLFADGTYGDGLNGVAGNVRGLFFGDAGQLAASGVAIIANIVYVGATATLAFKLIGKAIGNRVNEEDEREGLDVAEMGLEGYPADQITPGMIGRDTSLNSPLTPRVVSR